MRHRQTPRLTRRLENGWCKAEKVLHVFFVFLLLSRIHHIVWALNLTILEFLKTTKHCSPYETVTVRARFAVHFHTQWVFSSAWTVYLSDFVHPTMLRSLALSCKISSLFAISSMMGVRVRFATKRAWCFKSGDLSLIIDYMDWGELFYKWLISRQPPGGQN